jgi:hypothetical protein
MRQVKYLFQKTTLILETKPIAEKFPLGKKWSEISLLDNSLSDHF